MAGAVFGEVGVSLFVAGAAFRAILGDGRTSQVENRGVENSQVEIGRVDNSREEQRGVETSQVENRGVENSQVEMSRVE